ncbi:protoglobin domain-containing protein [Lysinibacillus sp. NPDC058147]|uniref:protoglobin domain-containing protein n=1 Tax=unclassified Lysinibacillus TaxID=2636778 RepID=UPI0036DB8E1F
MFWKNKKKEIDNGFILLNSNIKMSDQNGSEKDKQIKMIKFSIEELQLIKNLQPLIEEKLDDIVDLFYKNLRVEESLQTLINDNRNYGTNRHIF